VCELPLLPADCCIVVVIATGLENLMAMGSIQPQSEMSIRNPWGGGGGRVVVTCQPYFHLTAEFVEIVDASVSRKLYGSLGSVTGITLIYIFQCMKDIYGQLQFSCISLNTRE
jgi:hypothetical protein